MDKTKDAFSGCHPILQFFYFLAVIVTTAFVTHPVLLAASFVGAASYYGLLYRGKRRMGRQILLAVPLFLAVVLINALFNHYGVTILWYIRTGAITLEAIVYGIVLAFILWTAILWFSDMNRVMTTDRFIYLFGRLAPVLSLLLSMIFRFVPRFGRQLKVIREGQKCLGKDIEGQGLWKKLRNAFGELSMLVTWSLENGVATADSMRARGYGTAKRTSYGIFRWTGRDSVSAVILVLLYGSSLFGFWKGYAFSQYNPVVVIKGFSDGIESLCVYGGWLGFCCFPVLLALWDRILFGVRRRQTGAVVQKTLWYCQK